MPPKTNYQPLIEKSFDDYKRILAIRQEQMSTACNERLLYKLKELHYSLCQAVCAGCSIIAIESKKEIEIGILGGYFNYVYFTYSPRECCEISHTLNLEKVDRFIIIEAYVPQIENMAVDIEKYLTPMVASAVSARGTHRIKDNCTCSRCVEEREKWAAKTLPEQETEKQEAYLYDLPSICPKLVNNILYRYVCNCADIIGIQATKLIERINRRIKEKRHGS